MKRLIIALTIFLALALLGAGAFRLLVTDRVMDGDGMENPDYTQSAEFDGT